MGEGEGGRGWGKGENRGTLKQQTLTNGAIDTILAMQGLEDKVEELMAGHRRSNASSLCDSDERLIPINIYVGYQ